MREGGSYQRILSGKPGDIQIFTECWAAGKTTVNKTALHSGPPPTPTHAYKGQGRAGLGRVEEESFTGTNKSSRAGLSQIRLLVLQSGDLGQATPPLRLCLFTRKILIPLPRIVGSNKIKPHRPGRCCSVVRAPACTS